MAMLWAYVPGASVASRLMRGRFGSDSSSSVRLVVTPVIDSTTGSRVEASAADANALRPPNSPVRPRSSHDQSARSSTATPASRYAPATAAVAARNWLRRRMERTDTAAATPPTSAKSSASTLLYTACEAMSTASTIAATIATRPRKITVINMAANGIGISSGASDMNRRFTDAPTITTANSSASTSMCRMALYVSGRYSMISSQNTPITSALARICPRLPDRLLPPAPSCNCTALSAARRSCDCWVTTSLAWMMRSFARTWSFTRMTLSRSASRRRSYSAVLATSVGLANPWMSFTNTWFESVGSPSGWSASRESMKRSHVIRVSRCATVSRSPRRTTSSGVTSSSSVPNPATPRGSCRRNRVRSARRNCASRAPSWRYTASSVVSATPAAWATATKLSGSATASSAANIESVAASTLSSTSPRYS